MSSAKPAPIAYSYIRFSHPDQAKGDSLRRQTKGSADWCKRNGITLDQSLTLRDLGVSAFRGKHRSNPDKYALAAFLKAVETGRVLRGSYLIIENLDRLSREEERPALRLWMDILDAGVNIVQLHPETVFRHDKCDMVDIMRAIIELSRGHGESARKSERNGAAWKERRRRAREEGDFLTHRLPAWIEVRDGKRVAIPERKAAMKRIFALSAAGYGTAGISKKLTEEGVRPFGKSGHWARTYIGMILRDRRALGELQPRKSDGTPDGDPIPDYFPAVITEEEWQAARAGAAMRQRRTGRGRRWTDTDDELVRTLSVAEAAKRLGRTRPAVRARRSALARRGNKDTRGPAGGRHVNVFSGLLLDAYDGGAYYCATRSSKLYGTRWRILLNMASTDGRAPARSFPFTTFERAVLSMLAEVDPREVLGQTRGPDEVTVLEGKLTALEGRIAELEAELESGDIPSLARRLRVEEAAKRELAAQLAEARQRAANPLSAAWGETRSLIEALDKAPDPDDARIRLRAVLRRIVDEIWLLVVPRGWGGRDCLCAVQVWFAGGGQHRDYLIWHMAARSAGRKGGSTPGCWWARSMATVTESGDLDLRKREHAKKLEAVLASLDLEK
jgi:DNA invertase Pin-like site-specific DNA recombinase